MENLYDLLVIGGGINGAGIARDAAGRGLKVCLVEMDDLAGHTSSSSTKLIHGGLRYLEHFEFRLVHESLVERERLLTIAPHIIWPLRFVLPHDKGLRPKWMLRLGLFLYDNLGGRKLLPGTKSVDLRAPPHGEILEDRLISGFEYSDCWVDDARLVTLNCIDAKNRGADIRTQTECVGLDRGDDRWMATLRSAAGEEQIAARRIVNAAGPWVDRVLTRSIPDKIHKNLRLVKGSHLIFPRLFEGDHCYIFQNRDNRIIFAIPYEQDFTLIGTTDQLFKGDPAEIDISAEEATYLCNAANEYLRSDISPEDSVASYAGVRPLYENHAASNSTVTRDYQFELDRGDTDDAPALLSIFGGKLTTYRKLAEHALSELGIGGQSWTAKATLPGGDFPVEEADERIAQLQERYEWFPAAGIHRLFRTYGTLTTKVLGSAQSTDELGIHLGGNLYSAELEYLIREEFARSADDVLRRRSKLYLHLSDHEQQKVHDWFKNTDVSHLLKTNAAA